MPGERWQRDEKEEEAEQEEAEEAAGQPAVHLNQRGMFRPTSPLFTQAARSQEHR